MSINSTRKSQFDKIREDLWAAVLDYSGGRPYVWADGSARQLEEGEPAGDRAVMPTLTVDEFTTWKKDFAAANENKFTGSLRDRITAWSTESLPTVALPRELRGSWNAELKARVRQRLVEWYDAQKIPRPADLIQEPPKTQAPAQDQTELEALRNEVIECVRHMAWRELSELRIPATALLKYSQAKRRER